VRQLFSATVMFAASLVAVPGLTQAAETGPQVSFGKQSIVATNVTPRGRVIFFGMAHEPLEYSVTYAHRVMTVQADAAGNSHLDLEVDVAARSVWAVVDVTSGRYTVAATYPLTPLPFPSDSLKKNGQNELHEIDSAFGMVDILVVRPDTGAWDYSNAEDGPSDERGHGKGRTLSRVERFRPIGDPSLKPIKNLRKGDVLILFEPIRMLYFAMQVNEK
jgi:hypothetical protein